MKIYIRKILSVFKLECQIKQFLLNRSNLISAKFQSRIRVYYKKFLSSDIFDMTDFSPSVLGSKEQ